MSELLNTQKKGHLPLAQALVDKNHLTLKEVEDALTRYKTNHRFTDIQLRTLEEGEITEIIKIFVNFGDTIYKDFYIDYISLLGRNVIRFIDNNMRVDKSYVRGELSTQWLISQEITGKIPMFTALAIEEETMLLAGSRFAGRSFEKIDDLVKDSAAEFLTLHNGIYLVNMSNQGYELDLKPPVISSGKTLVGLPRNYVIPFYFSWGNFNLIVSGIRPLFK